MIAPMRALLSVPLVLAALGRFTLAEASNMSGLRQLWVPDAADVEAAATDFSLALTPEQVLGPYYPTADQDWHNYDLTYVSGQPQKAEGPYLHIKSQLLYTNGAPVADALVRIWQCDGNGIYNHPTYAQYYPDTTPDPYFQYFGETNTDEEGRFAFLTVQPVSYAGRPRHVHVRVFVSDVLVLTSQMYFPGDTLLQTDQFYQDVPPELQTQLLISPEESDDKDVMEVSHVLVIAPPSV